MKKVKGLTNRIVAMLMSGMLVVGAVPGTVLASDIPDDIGQTSEIAVEVLEEADTEEVSEEMYSQDALAQEEEAEVQYYTVTLDANGGYFENEWDDALGEAVEQAEVVKKQIPVGGTVDVVPVFTETDQDGQLIQTMVFAGWSLERDGELVAQAGEEYVPVDNYTLYAVWNTEDTSLGETAELELAEDNNEQTDAAQGAQEVEDAAGDTVMSEEGAVEGDTALEANTDPETENQQDIMSDQEMVSADEDIENNNEISSEASVSEEEAQPELNESTEEEETAKEDAANGVVSSGTCGDNLTWILDSAGTLTISGTGKMVDYDYQGGPWTKNLVKSIEIEQGVTSIGTSAFYECNNLTSATLADSVTHIGDFAFANCSKLCSVDISKATETIGFYAFNGCAELKNINIPEGIISIESSAFLGCRSLTEITIPKSLSSIEMWEFASCYSLNKVTIEDGVSIIKKGAFDSCINLSSIIIPASVTDIWEEAFSGCPSTLIIYGVKGSYAEQYAIDNNIEFRALEQSGETRSCLVYFDPNGGYNYHQEPGDPMAQYVFSYDCICGSEYGVLLDSITPYRKGYNFLGWFTAKEGGTQITETSIVDYVDELTLYAHWEEGTYVVTFDPNGGTVTPTTKTYKGYTTYGDLPQPLKNGFDFVGWYNGNSGPIKTNTVISFTNHSLKAKWEHTIEFDANGGTVTPESKKINDEEKYGEMPIPVKSGYTFDGWFKSLNGEDQVMDYDDIDLSVSKEKLYAHWSKEQPYDIDHWSFENSDWNFNYDYRITTDDLNKLCNNLTQRDANRIKEKYFSSSLSHRIPIYNEIYQNKDKYWGGSCYGMSSWCALVGNNIKSAKDVQFTEKLSDYHPREKQIESAINFYHAQQSFRCTMEIKKAFMSKTQNEQIDLLKKQIKQGPVLIDFCYRNAVDYTPSDGAHAIVGYALNEGDFTNYVRTQMENVGRAESLNNEWEFTECISIYDPIYPNVPRKMYLSTNTEQHVWCLPFNGIVCSSKGSLEDSGWFQLCTNKSEFLNIVDYNSGNLSYIYHAENLEDYPLLNCDNGSYRIVYTDKNGNRLVLNLNDELLSEDYLHTIIYDSGENGENLLNRTKNIFLTEADGYEVESDNDLNVMLDNTDSLTTVQSRGGGKITFEGAKTNVTTEKADAIRICITSDDFFEGTSYHTVEVLNDCAQRLSLSKEDDEGIVVEGDLDNLIITTINDNRTEDFEEWPISTDQDSILIKEEEGELVPYVDNDGDGSYESILPISIENGCITGLKDTVYTGKSTYSGCDILVNGKRLSTLTDCDVYVSNTTNVGIATVEVYGKGKYTGKLSNTYKILPRPIENVTINSSEDYHFINQGIKPSVSVISNGLRLTDSDNYDVYYKNNLNAGTAKVIVKGKGNYTGTIEKAFKIYPFDLTGLAWEYDNADKEFERGFYTIWDESKMDALIELGKEAYAYTDNYLKPKPKVMLYLTDDRWEYINGFRRDKDRFLLIQGRDYTVSYKNNKNVGKARITITGKGNFKGTMSRSFEIKKAAQSITAKSTASSIAVGKTAKVSITGNKGKKSYKSSNTAIATVNAKTGIVTAKKVGTVKITATSTATSNYNSASKTVTIKVVPAATTSLTAANQATGIKLTWKKVTGANGYKVYRGSTLIKTITSGSTVTFTDTKANTNGTKYTYKVVAKGTTGDSTLSRSRVVYRVARPAVSSLKNSASKKMTVKWGKNAKANGYQIQYSTDKAFKSGNKAVTVTGASTVYKVIGSLTKGKTYYVRIRTYKTVGSAKYWSVWSSARSVKISK